MLVTFKSKAAAEVLMYEAHAKRILDLFHKDLKRGIITAAEVGAAVATLEAEIAANKAHPAPDEIQHEADAQRGEPDDEQKAAQFVSFGTRAYPLLEMLRAAHKGGNDVMWGI